MDHADFRRHVSDALDRLAAEPPDDDPDGTKARVRARTEALERRLARIATVTAAARSNWFWFFGILAYIVITLMGLSHVAYFSADAKADLPVVGFSVDLTSFLYLAPVLLTVVFLYLLNQIELLWEDLSDLPPTEPKDGLPIISRLPVWLLLEHALMTRDLLMARKAALGPGTGLWGRIKGWFHPYGQTPDAPRRVVTSPLGWLGGTATALLVWWATPAVLTWIWWESHVKHDLLLSGVQGFCLLISVVAAVFSHSVFRAEMGEDAPKEDTAETETTP